MVRTVTAADRTPFVRATDRRLTIVTGAGGRFSDRRLVVSAVSGTHRAVRPANASVPVSTSAGSLVWNATCSSPHSPAP